MKAGEIEISVIANYAALDGQLADVVSSRRRTAMQPATSSERALKATRVGTSTRPRTTWA